MKTRTRWTENEWKKVLFEAAEEQRPELPGDVSNTVTHKFLNIGQKALPEERRRSFAPGVRIPASLHDYARLLGIDIVRTTILIRNKKSPEEVQDGEIRDLLKKINDTLEIIAESVMENGVKQKMQKPTIQTVPPEKRAKKKRILIVGLLPEQFQRLLSRFTHQATLLAGWHPEKNAGNPLPDCDHIICMTKFVAHSKCNKALKKDATFHYCTGGQTACANLIRKILHG